MTETAAGRTYAERHQRGLAGLARLRGIDDASALFDELCRARGYLGMLAVDLVGDTWERPVLAPRDRSIAVLACLFVHQAKDELAVHLRAALHNGVTRPEIDEIVLHVAAYAGFPPAMHGQRVVDATWRAVDGVDVLPDRSVPPGLDDSVRRAQGAEVWARMSGTPVAADPDALHSSMAKGVGGIAGFALDWAFGELWSRPEMRRRDRSIAVIAILALLSLEVELRIHIQVGIRHGLTREEIEELFVHLSIYAGIPRAINAFRLARSVWQEIDAAPDAP